MSRRMIWRQLLILFGFKLLDDGLDISKKDRSKLYNNLYSLDLMLIIFDWGKIRLRAQKISARTKTMMHLKTFSGHHSTMKLYIDWAFIADQIHNTYLAIVSSAPVHCHHHDMLLCLSLKEQWDWKYLRYIKKIVFTACFGLGCLKGPPYCGQDTKMKDVVPLKFPFFMDRAKMMQTVNVNYPSSS